MAQILGPEDRSLLIGRPASLRRWAATHLGAGKPARKGRRPPTNLRPIATAVVFAETSSPFQQRLLFERVMARHVPASARRDLKPPAWLHLDPRERFPRLGVRFGSEACEACFGPFRNRLAAERARDALHKRFPLRPCDYVFEPQPELPLGLGCLFAQLRTCAAPCLCRVTEAVYRDLAALAADFLGRPEARSEPSLAWLPPFVSRARGGSALVVECGRAGIELYPVRDGAVLEEDAATAADRSALTEAAGRLAWRTPPQERDDRAWLAAWLYGPRKSGCYLLLAEPLDAAAVAARVQAVLS